MEYCVHGRSFLLISVTGHVQLGLPLHKLISGRGILFTKSLYQEKCAHDVAIHHKVSHPWNFARLEI